ncbi:MAG: DUF6783 domain-containing protein [Clostridiales bacterium]|nr:DUF6783 domain-containing protein [Clostridiales bacterium]
MRDKSPTNCDAQLPESNFKTRSRATANNFLNLGFAD